MGFQSQYPQMLNHPQKQNLVEWQLDFKDEYLKIERFCRSDIRMRDAKGNTVYVRNPDPASVFLNDKGTNDVLMAVVPILNKNTLLSYYREEDIHKSIKSILHEIRHMLYANAEVYGIMENDIYKGNMYSMLIVTIDSAITSAYRRAINGEERKGLGEARIVNQTEPMLPQNINFYGQQGQNKGGLRKLLPWNWGK